MYISQCIIVKNEEKNIEHCLTHLKSVVDEQIVVDTGSTDRTVEIAKKLGAKVFHFDWIDDFSAARNFALDKAKGDWIIFLDCDEYFSEESIPLIKQCINNLSRNKDINGIVCELINIDLNKNVISTVKNVSARIFRNKNYIKYKNKVHEVLFNEKRDNNQLLCFEEKKLKILHTGYDKNIIIDKNKNNRNIKILQDELSSDVTNPQINLYLSKQYYLDKQYDKSLHYAKLALDYANENTNNMYCLIYSSILYTMLTLNKSYDEMRDVFDEAIIKDNDYPDYYRAMAMAAFREKKIKQAIDYFEKCLYYCENYNKLTESIAVGQIVNIYYDLLKCYLLDNNKHKIVELSVALLKTDKYDLKILVTLIKTFLTQEKEANIISFLNKIYDYNKFKDKIFLLKASEITNSNILKDYYQSLLSDNELNAINYL